MVVGVGVATSFFCGKAVFIFKTYLHNYHYNTFPMGYYESYCATTFQYELIQKFRHLDHKRVFGFNKVVLSSNSKNFLLKEKLSFSLFLQIYTSHKGFSTSRHVDSSKSSIRVLRGDPAGYKVTLRKKELFVFFTKIAERSDKKGKTYSSNNKPRNSYSSEVKEVLTFTQLEHQYKYMQSLSGLQISLVAQPHNPQELYFFLTSYFRY